MRTRCPELKLLMYPCVEFFVRLWHRASINSCVQDGRTTLEQRETEVNRIAVIRFSTVKLLLLGGKIVSIGICKYLERVSL